MPKLDQRGAIQFIVLLILLAGILGGVYLATREEPFKLFPQAKEAKVSGPIPRHSPISFGKAIKFNNEGSNKAYVVIKPVFYISAAPSEWTLEGWINTPKPKSGTYLRDYSIITLTKPQSLYDAGYIFRLSLETQESNGNSRPLFSALLADSYETLNSNYISVGANNQTNLKPLTWNHVAVTYSASGNKCILKLYINGTLTDTAERIKNPTCKISTQQPEQIWLAKPPASLGGISGYYYPGTLDSIRLIRKVIYTSSFTPPIGPFSVNEYFADLIALYNFDRDLKEESTYHHQAQAFGSVKFVNSKPSGP